VGSTARDETGVEADQGFIPSEGGWERCGVEGTPQAPAAASDVTLAFVLSTVIVKGGEACKRCRLFAADPTKLGHADDERKRGPFADTGNAQHEIERVARSW
jgi:hypothetical protein